MFSMLPFQCFQRISQLTIRRRLYGKRNDNPVIHFGDTWGGPGSLFRCLFLCIRTDRSSQNNFAAHHFNRDAPCIRLRIAHQGLLDLLLEIGWGWLSSDHKEIGNSSDTGETLYRTFCISLLEVIFDFALKCHPTMIDRHLNFVSWNTGIPFEGIEYGFGQIEVSTLGRAG